jgi:isocitrate/isopropylmalate dehydrogenase
MICWLAKKDIADGSINGIENVTGRGVSTNDLGGTGGTKDVAKAVCDEIQNYLGNKDTVRHTFS